MIGRASRQLPPRDAGAAVVPEGQPGRSVDLLHRPALVDAAARRRSTRSRSPTSRSASRWSAAWRRSTSSARRSTRCASTSIRGSWPRASIGIDEVATAIQNANVNLPTGTIYGERTFVVQTNGQLMRGVGLRADDHRLPQRQSRPARRGGARLRRRRERQDGELAERRALHLPVDPEAAGHNVVQMVDAIKALLPGDPRAAAGVGDARRPQRPLGHDPRVGPRRQADAARRPSPSSSSSSSSSCATSRRRSSPAWRCPARSSARSR